MNQLTKRRYYHIAKASKVGSTCICAGCGRPFIKNRYNQVFCRELGKTVCKDRYHNSFKERELQENNEDWGEEW